MQELLEFYGQEITEFHSYRSARCIHSMAIELSPSQKKNLKKILRFQNG